MKPGLEVTPFALDGADGHIEGFGRLGHGQADEVAQVDDGGLARIGALEFLDRLVNGQDVIIGRGDGDALIELRSLPITPAFERALASDLLDDDVVHGPAGGGKEVSPMIPRLAAAVGQTQVGLVHESGGLEGLPGRQMSHPLSGHGPQGVVDERQQGLARGCLRNRVCALALAHSPFPDQSRAGFDARVADSLVARLIVPDHRSPNKPSGGAAIMETPYARALISFSLLLAAGCHSQQPLVSEENIPELRAMKEVARDQPVETTIVPTRVNDDRIDLAVHQSGNREAARTIVLMHGLFADSSTWRFVRGELGRDCRVLLVDLPGCGGSACPTAGCSPDELAERLAQALEQVESTATTPVTLVGHSLGGTLALRMMGSEQLRSRHAGWLDRVDSLVLVAPADLEMIHPPPLFVDLAEMDYAMIVLADALGILERRVVEGVRESFVDPNRALHEEAESRLAILRDPKRFRTFQALLRETLPMQEGRLNWEAAERIVADYERVQVPCLILWGARDETLSKSTGFKLAAQLPRADLRIVEQARHSPHIEQPRRCIDMVRSFVRMPRLGLVLH